MVVCRFFQAGKCAYGNSCKFEHPGQTTGFRTQAGGLVDEGFTVSGDTITTDLTKERPIWRLSSYAPGRDPPAQLVDGKDVSPEEMRFRAWELNMQGLGQQFANEATQLESVIDTQINNILRDIPGAVRFMTDANKNRDGYRYKTPSETDLASTPTAPASAFGTAASAFGAPAATSSAYGQPTSAFGAPILPTSAFGQSQQPTSAFGQPVQPAQPTSAFGAPTPAFAAKTSAFGQPSMGLGSATTPAFGQPAFGKPAFGQPAFGQPAFGVTAAPAATTTTTPAFGQTAFGSVAPTSAFGGSAAQQQPTSAFGATATTQPTTVFGNPAFGAPAFGQTAFAQTASPFGTAAVGQQQAANPFAQAQQPSTPTTSAFGQPVNAFASPGQQAPISAFSQPQQQPVPAFSQPQQPVSAFGAPTAAGPTPGVFGQPANAFVQQPPAGQATTSAFGQTAFAQQPTSAFGDGGGGGGPFGNLLNPQKEAPVASMGGGAAGAPAGTTGGKWDDPPIQYTDEEIQAFKAPEFVLGSIPCVPPAPEMCRWVYGE